MATSLLDLPDELIESILWAIRPPYVFPLATVCRRLNRVAIDIFLTVYNVSLPSKNLSIGLPPCHFHSSLDVLPALAICFSAVGMTIDQLSCGFVTGAVKNIEMLNAFLKRLSALKVVMLDLPLPLAETVRAEQRLSFEAAVQRLLDTVISKGCTDLTVARNRFRRYCIYRPVTEPYIKPSSQDRLKQMLMAYKSSRPVSVQHSLCSLHIQTFVRYLASFYTQILNWSCITHLTLDSFIFNQDLKDLLSAVSMPQLTRVTILNMNPDQYGLSKFFRRHPTITTFDFLPGSSCNLSIRSCLWKSMSGLTTFECNPLQTRLFLEPPHSLPKLQKLSINPLHSSDKSYDGYERVFEALAHRGKTLTLSLRFLQDHCTLNWLAYCIDVDRPERFLRCVQHLEILGPANSHLGDVLRVLPQWFSTFPSLHHVFIGHSFIEGVTEARLQQFIEGVKAECPRLETLTVQHPNSIDQPQVHRLSM